MTNNKKSRISKLIVPLCVVVITAALVYWIKTNPPESFAIVGGASANKALRSQIEQLCANYDAKLLLAPLEFCSDNAAMIGRVAVEQYLNSDFVAIDEIDVHSRISF